MATYEFPALGFDPAPGNPANVSTQADAIRAHAGKLGGYADQLNGLKAGDFEGDTAKAFQAKLSSLPPDLRKAHDAYQSVATALDGFATTLESAQRQARSLETQAAQAKSRATTAQNAVNAHNTPPTNETPAAKTPREQDLDTAKNQAGSANQDLQGFISQARRLHDHLQSEAASTAATVRKAASNPPYRKPAHHWWDSVGDFASGVLHGASDWVKKHADFLRKLSGILKTISAVCGLLAFIPVVGEFFGAVALITAGVALGIDVLLKLSTGEGSWWSIGLDAALTFLPLGAGKALGALGKLGKGADEAADVGRLLETGGRLGRRPASMADAWYTWAPKAYDEIRNADDVGQIAERTGWPADKIQLIKQHLFFNEHQLDAGVARFDPDPDIAEAWLRMSNGEPTLHDIRLLEHEFHESEHLSQFGGTYRDAHQTTEAAGHVWDPEKLSPGELQRLRETKWQP